MVVETEGQYVKIKQSNMREMIQVNWHLGFTSYGGPAVNFQLVSSAYREIQGNSGD
jgi:hypothetical protein